MKLRPEGAAPLLSLLTLLALLGGLLVSCRSPSLEVEFAGCADVLAPAEAPTCVLDLDEPDLRLWARADPGAEVVVETGAELTAEPEAVQEGTLLRLKVLPGATELRIA
ncbi:MAG: hypothetical protein KDD47_16435, partial [Acidobacteria bacterium]|nr:hypothetical protein [Acidobacteriota bacterium]